MGYTQLPEPEQNKSYDFIHVCHDECSYGILGGLNHPITIGDIIFNQLLYTPQLTDEQLTELSKQYPSLTVKIEDIKNNIFE